MLRKHISCRPTSRRYRWMPMDASDNPVQTVWRVACSILTTRFHHKSTQLLLYCSWVHSNDVARLFTNFAPAVKHRHGPRCLPTCLFRHTASNCTFDLAVTNSNRGRKPSIVANELDEAEDTQALPVHATVVCRTS